MLIVLKQKVVAELRQNGWVVIPKAMEDISSLKQFVSDVGVMQMHPAGVGRGSDHHYAVNVRSDSILWLQKTSSPALSGYFAMMEELSNAINENLFLGLFEYECHLALYPKSTFYQKHKDAFATDSSHSGNRVLSTVFYLNEEWKEGDGGELVIYEEARDIEIVRIKPEAGTLVLFLSEEFPHEVLPANKERWSLTGWFRTRGY